MSTEPGAEGVDDDWVDEEWIDQEWVREESDRPYEWVTAVGWGAPVGKIVGGYPLVDLIGRISYAQALHLVLKQELPDARTTEMFEACLTALIDNGFRNTVALTARFAASANPDPIAAVAAGILGIGRHTAGAQRYVVELIEQGMALQADAGCTREEAAAQLVDAVVAGGQNVPGLGTKMHKPLGHDPRAQRLVEIATTLGFTTDERYLLYTEVHHTLERIKNRSIVVNADGAMGAIFAAMGFDSLDTAAIEIAVMLPSIMGHAVEEIRRGSPMRYLPQAALRYVGHPPRPVPDDLAPGHGRHD